MELTLTRRRFLCAAALLPITAGLAPQLQAARVRNLHLQLATLEKRYNGRLGMTLLDTASGHKLQYRGNERFPMCSTSKTLLAAVVLNLSLQQPGLLERRIYWDTSERLSWMPVTEKHYESGMTVNELCQAMLQYSDNLAANLMLKLVNGPAAVTTLARSLGDNVTRLDRTEPALNSAIPGDKRDTTTPLAMASDLQKLAFGNGLPHREQQLWIRWLKGNTTGKQSIAAGVPAVWKVGDKTGSGDYGTTNDVALLWPPQRQPLVLTVYFTQPDKTAASNRTVLAETARLTLATWR
ncbi:beta-lactamase class A [Izhakiella capsodis]|uniref:Beta-lactamase n=1 Tax=Izhakiella capsodis TaxID=1367852 RepID=A0A1I4VBV7_9GAMM|nr:class A beta-lactamase [Izhakiella capsodis]SFM98655.1 beta-lactamase class A [Izhakiella capsodis]